MPEYEYKTVALPRSVAKRRRRRQSEADLVAEQLGKVLNDEATDGWEYVRAETLTTPGSRGMFQKAEPAAYVVLIFQRMRPGSWRQEDPAAYRNSPSPAPAAHAAPVAPAAPVMSAPVPQAAPTRQEPEIRFVSTSTQPVSISENSGTVTPMRPLGPATE